MCCARACPLPLLAGNMVTSVLCDLPEMPSSPSPCPALRLCAAAAAVNTLPFPVVTLSDEERLAQTHTAALAVCEEKERGLRHALAVAEGEADALRCEKANLTSAVLCGLQQLTHAHDELRAVGHTLNSIVEGYETELTQARGVISTQGARIAQLEAALAVAAQAPSRIPRHPALTHTHKRAGAETVKAALGTGLRYRAPLRVEGPLKSMLPPGAKGRKQAPPLTDKENVC